MMTMETVVLVAIPCVSALIGWMTNFIAVRMLFRPRTPRRFAGITVVGLIPRRKRELARTIGETVERELISHRDIQKVLSTEGFHREIVTVVRGKIDDFVREQLGQNALFALFANGEIVASIKDALVDEIEQLIPDTMEKLLGRVESQIDFKTIVQTKIEAFELSRLERIIYTIARKELRAIELWGALLGFFVGLVQTGLLVLGGYHG